jgi:hypothetical protein
MKFGSKMNIDDQKKFIIDYVREWVSSEAHAEIWYETEVIPALKMTPEQAVKSGNFEPLVNYLESIKFGGYA